MAEKNQEECCSIESVVTVDERGQMVLPKSVRETMGIKPGDKLAVVAVKSGGKACCITLIRAEAFSGSVKVMLKPIIESSDKDG